MIDSEGVGQFLSIRDTIHKLEQPLRASIV